MAYDYFGSFWSLLYKVSLHLSIFASFLVLWNVFVRASTHAICCALNNDRILYGRRWRDLCWFLLYGYHNRYPAMDVFVFPLESSSNTLVVNFQGRHYYAMLLRVSVFLLCPFLSLTVLIWIPTSNVFLLYLVIRFICIVSYVRKLCCFWGLWLSRTLFSFMVLYSISIYLDSLMVLHIIQSFIWLDTVICIRALFSNTSLMGNHRYEGSPLVVNMYFRCYQLYIYGIILLDNCLFLQIINLSIGS